VTSATEILVDAFGRVHESMREMLPGLDAEALLWQPDPAANPIGWLAWHLTRVQDDHLAGVGQTPQVWTGQGFIDLFALPYSPGTIGYGQTAEEVRQFSVGDPELLLAYHGAVHERTLTILAGLDDAGFARIVDTRWDPPVTAAVRLVSVINDTMAHLGQMGYLRGLYQRR
jgi:DinB superfamily